MSVIMIPLLLLGPGLIIASFFAKRKAVCVASTLVGVMLLVWLTHAFSGILLVYEREHRAVENHCHREIIAALDGMLAQGRVDEAKKLTDRYLKDTADSSSMRNPLNEIVKSLRKERTEQSTEVDAENRAP